jgi:hypothetical protein
LQSAFGVFDTQNVVLDDLALQAWWQRLGQLVGLFSISHYQCVQVSGTANFEFCLCIALANLDKLGVRASGLLQKVADVCNLFRHVE